MLKPIINWVKLQEYDILRNGEPLSEKFVEIAKDIGVKHPEKVRYMKVNKVPLPPAVNSMHWHDVVGEKAETTAGVAYGYGIYITRDVSEDPGLLYHELVHVKQAEEIGLDDFIKKYIMDCIKYGYKESPFEKEAYEKMYKFEKNNE